MRKKCHCREGMKQLWIKRFGIKRHCQASGAPRQRTNTMMIDGDIAKLAHISKHPIVYQKISQLRDQKTDNKRFRELVHEIGSLLGYEATVELRLNEIPNVPPSLQN